MQNGYMYKAQLLVLVPATDNDKKAQLLMLYQSQQLTTNK